MTTKRIIGLIALYTVLTGALGAYFYFTTVLVNAQHDGDRCQTLLITVDDSLTNPLLTAQEVQSYLFSHGQSLPGKPFSEIDTQWLEEQLTQVASIKECNAVRYINGDLLLKIKQHRPLCRLDTENGSFFLSDKGYLFPMVNAFRAPVLPFTIAGPFEYPARFRGPIRPDDSWLQSLYNMATYITDSPFWSDSLHHVEIAHKNEIILHPLHQEINLMIGDITNYTYKLWKLEAYYQCVDPMADRPVYAVVDARFGDQIVCKKTKQPIQHGRTNDFSN